MLAVSRGARKTSSSIATKTAAAAANIIFRHEQNCSASVTGRVADMTPMPPIMLSRLKASGRYSCGSQCANDLKADMSAAAKPKPIRARAQISMT